MIKSNRDVMSKNQGFRNIFVSKSVLTFSKRSEFLKRGNRARNLAFESARLVLERHLRKLGKGSPRPTERTVAIQHEVQQAIQQGWKRGDNSRIARKYKVSRAAISKWYKKIVNLESLG